MRVKTSEGETFDAHQWDGDADNRPDWLAEYPVEDDRFYGDLLAIGPYLVRVGRWVLRSDRRGDIFPVPEDMFGRHYKEIETDG